MGRMKTWDFTVAGKSETGSLTWNPNWTLNQLQIVDGFDSGGSQTCNMNPTNAASSGYDDLGRLIGTNCGAIWGQIDSYDQYDNLTKSIPAGSAGVTFNPGYSPTTNQFTCANCYYLNNGDVWEDPLGNWYGYDGFNKLWYINGDGTQLAPCLYGGTCLVNDAFGRTVEIDGPGQPTEIWYTQLGKTAYMFAGGGISYAYWPLPGGGTLLEKSETTDYYLHKDWLGNARISTAVVARTTAADQAFAAYGEVYNSFGAPAQNQTMFIGLTQDVMSGMFDAPNREFAQNQGRWLSPDPANSGWNQYAYAANPYSEVDPSGLDPLNGHWQVFDALGSQGGDCFGDPNCSTDYINGVQVSQQAFMGFQSMLINSGGSITNSLTSYVYVPSTTYNGLTTTYYNELGNPVNSMPTILNAMGGWMQVDGGSSTLLLGSGGAFAAPPANNGNCQNHLCVWNIPPCRYTPCFKALPPIPSASQCLTSPGDAVPELPGAAPEQPDAAPGPPPPTGTEAGQSVVDGLGLLLGYFTDSVRCWMYKASW
jgi:RHS repeat-associated protein